MYTFIQNKGQGFIIGFLKIFSNIFGYSFNISTISVLENWGIIDVA